MANADLSSHDAFLDGPPHETFARLRREEPVSRTAMADGEPFWNLVRYDDVLAATQNFEAFSSARGIRMEDQSLEEYEARKTFQETDPPVHTATRRKVARAFAKPVIARFEADIRALCDDILDEALASDEFDATEAIARQLPMRILGRIIGTPDADMDWLVTKGDALMSNADPDFTDHVVDRMGTDAYRLMPFNSPAGAELYDYARALRKDRLAAGTKDGVLDMILAPFEDGSEISEEEFRNVFCLLVAAGNDTTRYSIAAGMHALAVGDTTLAAIRAADMDAGANEIIRWASPTMHFRRTLTRDVELHGTNMQAGDKVVLWYVSANRDETAFEAPFELRLERTPNRHLAFGQGGPHVCLGMWLARLEVRCLFEELARRVRAIELAGEPAHVRSNFVGGYKRLPVRVERA